MVGSNDIEVEALFAGFLFEYIRWVLGVICLFDQLLTMAMLLRMRLSNFTYSPIIAQQDIRACSCDILDLL